MPYPGSREHYNQDLRGIKDDRTWPGMLLPFKRITRDENGFQKREYGYLVNPAKPSGEVTLHLGNMFVPKPTDPVVKFDSPEALLDAGWEVD